MAINIRSALPVGGVNLVDAPTTLQKDECQWAKNVWPKAVNGFSPRGSLEHRWKTNFGWAGVELKVYNAFRFGAEIPTVGGLALVMQYVNYAGTLYTWLMTINSDVGDSPYAGQVRALYGRGCFVDIGLGAVLFLDGNGPGWVISDGTLDFHMWGNDAVNAARMFHPISKGVASWGLFQSDEDGGHFSTEGGDLATAADPRHYAGGLPAGWRPRIAVMAHERLVYFNLADTHRDTMVWSDKNNPALVDAALQDGVWYANTTLLLDRDGPYTRLGADNQDITAALAVATSNEQNLMEQSILVWKRDRVYMVQGEPGQTHEFGTNPLGTLGVKELSVRAGCVGQAACCSTPYGVFWVGTDDVWFMAVGTLPMRVGTKISPRLRAQAESDDWKTQCTYAGGRLIVALVSPGGGADSPACDEQWWLDLRRGPPQGWRDARWFGPQVFATALNDFAVYGVQFLLRDAARDVTEALVPYQRIGDGAYFGAGFAHSDVAVCSLDGGSGVDSPLAVAGPYPRSALQTFETGAVIDTPKLANVIPASAYIATVARDFPWRLESAFDGSEHLHRRYYAAVGGVSALSAPSFGGIGVVDSTITWVRDDVQPVVTADQLASNAVVLDVLSREETLGDAAVMKNLDGVELAHDLAHPMVIDLVSLGQGLQSLTGRQSDGASAAGGQMAAGSGRLNTVVLAGNVIGARFIPSAADGVRCPGFSHAFRLKTRSAFVLERTYFFACSFATDPAGARVTIIAQVPAGEYATALDVGAAMASAMNQGLDAAGDAVLAALEVYFGQDFNGGNDLSPFAYFKLDTSGITPGPNPISAAIPLMNRGSIAVQVGEHSFGAGPLAPGVPGFEAFDVYDDTTYLMSLLGFIIGPNMAENRRGVYAWDNFTTPIFTMANTPFAGPRAYPRFTVHELNFRFRTFAKRPT